MELELNGCSKEVATLLDDCCNQTQFYVYLTIIKPILQYINIIAIQVVAYIMGTIKVSRNVVSIDLYSTTN